MPTNFNVVYPPIVNSSINAFLATSENLEIPFSLPKVVNFNNVKHMAIRIVQQSNNKTVVNTDKYYDGIIYVSTSSNNIKKYFDYYSVIINKNDIKSINKAGWNEDTYYKIQLRFGYSELNYNDRATFFQWKKQQSSINGYSEWSNVIITKAIAEPRVEILNNLSANNYFSDVILNYSINVESNRFPKFQGGYSNSVEEPLDKYRFKLYKGLNVNDNALYLVTDWLQFNGSGKDEYTGLVEYTFNQPLEANSEQFYTIIFEIITKNQYQKSSEPYTFKINENYLNNLNHLQFFVKDNSGSGVYSSYFSAATPEVFNNFKYLSPYVNNESEFIRAENGNIIYKVPNSDEEKILTENERVLFFNDFDKSIDADENGYLSIYLLNGFQTREVIKINNEGEEIKTIETFQENLDGTYILSRADEKTNFTIWEDLAHFEFFDNADFNTELTLFYEDFTIESGIKYKYMIQKESVLGFRSVPCYEINSKLETAPSHFANFEYCYLYCNGIQIKLDLDVKIQSFKHTRLFQKQDSLNSKYPIILRNGLSNYGEFSLGGKITLHSDDGTFLLNNPIDNNGFFTGGYYYNGNLVIDANKYLKLFNRFQQTDLPHSEQKRGNVFDFNHSKNNIFMERIYRQCVEEFLNNGKYKLYKSPTEGNMIVTLTNVSLTPNQQLGRLISDFSSTVYEIAENTLDNLKTYEINPLNVITNNMFLAIGEKDNKYKKVINQVRGAFDGKYVKTFKISESLYKELLEQNFFPNLYFHRIKNEYITYSTNLPTDLLNYIFSSTESTYLQEGENPYFDTGLNGDADSSDNIINWIKNQEEQEISEEKAYSLERISAIQIELYPKYDIEQQIINLQQKLIEQYLTDIERLEAYLQIAKYQLILQQYDISQSNVITMILNGKEIMMMPGRIYRLDDVDVKSLYLKYTRPILINYIADLKEIDNLPKVVISTQELTNWGQLSGLFTNTEKILNNHKIERNSKQLIVSEDEFNYNLYQSLNIMDIIKEKVHKRVFSLYGSTSSLTKKDLIEQINKFLLEENISLLSYEEQIEEINKLLALYRPLAMPFDDSSSDIWIDNDEHYITYKFVGLDVIEIEGDENTEIVFNSILQTNNDNTMAYYNHNRKTLIGPTNKFTLNQLSESDVKELRFSKPSYGIINYRAICTITVQGTQQV